MSVGLWNAAGATVLALVAGGAGLVCRRPAVLHALWLLVLLKLLCPPLWAVPIQWPEQACEPTAVEQDLPAVVAQVEQPDPEPAEPLIVLGTPLSPDVSETKVAPSLEPEAPIATSPSWSWTEIALGAWIGGAALWWG